MSEDATSCRLAYTPIIMIKYSNACVRSEYLEVYESKRFVIRNFTQTSIMQTSDACKHPCLTDPSKVLILLGVSSQVLGGELET